MLPTNKHKMVICVKQEVSWLNVYVVGVRNETGMRNGCSHLVTPSGFARWRYSLTRLVVLLDVTSKVSIGDKWIETATHNRLVVTNLQIVTKFFAGAIILGWRDMLLTSSFDR